MTSTLHAGKERSGRRRTRAGRVLAAYDYQNRQSELVFQVVRRELVDTETNTVVGKAFLQRHRAADGSWAWNMEGVERVLYRLPAILTAGCVWLVEGECDVHTLEGLGLVATTLPGGARAHWFPQYTASLAGRQVVLCGDNDKPGLEHMARCAHELRSVATLFRCALPEGSKDVTVFIWEQGHSRADLEALVEPLQLPAA